MTGADVRPSIHGDESVTVRLTEMDDGSTRLETYADGDLLATATVHDDELRDSLGDVLNGLVRGVFRNVVPAASTAADDGPTARTADDWMRGDGW